MCSFETNVETLVFNVNQLLATITYVLQLILDINIMKYAIYKHILIWSWLIWSNAPFALLFPEAMLESNSLTDCFWQTGKTRTDLGK